ncbi:hypothetical protein HY493_01225 [Candidatus Woesearchaeota archaeon]|nr:hypothetical protein [Candidatus Woesearchaeota archaeon]
MPKELTREQQEFRSRIYGAIYWTSLAAILLWYVLKSAGIIQTPLWIELLPIAFAVFGAGAVLQEMRSDIRTLKEKTRSLEQNTHHVEFAMHHLENDMHQVKARLDLR